MPGSNAASAYNGLIQINGPHLPLVQRSQFVIPSKAIASVSYRIPYAKDYMATTVNLLYSGYSPYGNSFTYSNDMNGDGIATDLIYIPKEKGDINQFKTYFKLIKLVRKEMGQTKTKIDLDDFMLFYMQNEEEYKKFKEIHNW